MLIRTRFAELDLSLSAAYLYVRLGRRELCIARDRYGWRID